jgi:hypothetical protein
MVVDIYSVAITNDIEQEDYASCFLCGKIGESRAQLCELNGWCTN